MDQAADQARRVAPDGGISTRRLLGTRDYLALGIGAVLLIGLVASSAWLAVTNRHGLERASHARTVLSALNDISVSINDAETGQRGYLLTGKGSYLAPYRAALERLPAEIAQAEQQLGPASPLAPSFQQLKAALAIKTRELARTVVLAQGGDRDAAMALVQSDLGRDAMDRVRGIYKTIRNQQLGSFLGELAAVNHRGRVTVFVNLAGLAGVIAMAGIVGSSLLRTLRRLHRARTELAWSNAQLEGLNQDLERHVSERTSELTEANQEIQRFAYIVSHDLRAPLVNIMGFTAELEAATSLLVPSLEALATRETVASDVVAAAREDLPEAIRFIKASTSKMDRLIGAILKLSREGRRVLALEMVDMRALFAAIVDSLQHQVQQAGVEIEIGAAPALRGDRVVLEQIFGNLVDNALKYRAQGRPGRIRIGGEDRGSYAVFTVADNGRGIAQRDRDRVFELFRRAGDQSVPGEGIGLAHVRALVRRMGGTIDLDSTPNVGTIFSVRLPFGSSQNRSIPG